VRDLSCAIRARRGYPFRAVINPSYISSGDNLTRFRDTVLLARQPVFFA
jgi:hypothetical protein